MIPGAGVLVQGCGHISHIVKRYYFLKNLLLYTQAYIRQTKCKVIMTKEDCTKIVITVNMYFLPLCQYTSQLLLLC